MEKTETEKELFSLKDVCAKTGKCYRTIHRYARMGKIKTIRLGASVMVPKAELLRITTRGF
jgi:predicted site-specific integrase-resolvase